MINHRKLLACGLSLLAATCFLAACESDRGAQQLTLTNEKISGDLVDKTVAASAVGEFRIGKETYAALKEQRQEGRKTVARVALRALDAKAGTGVEGELELTYRGDGRIEAVTSKSLHKMEEKYAGRLAELQAFPLHFAANIGDLHKVERELQGGAAVDLPEEKKASTALMFASERGFVEIVQRLLTQGANVNHRNRYGFTALHAAASNNHGDVVKLLLGKGAQVDAQDELGQTPLYFAAERGHLEIVRLLAAQGADINRSAKKGWPPLYAATSGNFLEVVKFLLEQGATVNIKTGEGSHSPLLIAASNKNPEMVRLLLAAGADRSARLSSHHAGYRNQTALDIAKKQGDTAVVELLERPAAR